MQRESFLSDMGPRTEADADRLSILSVDPSLIIPSEIRTLSDTDLIAATRALRPGIVGYAWLAVPVLTVAGAWLFGAVAGVLACIGAIGACKLALYLHERSPAVARGQLAKREFCARYHIGALSLDEAAAATTLAQDPALDVILLFRAWALPHGGHQYIRIEFGRADRIAIYTTPFLGDLQRQEHAQSRMAQLNLALKPAYSERLRNAIADFVHTPHAAPSERMLITGQPLAGLPCDLVVLRRGEPALRTSMNYRGIASLHKLTPAERLVSDVLSIEGEITGQELSEIDPLLVREHKDLVARSI